MDGPPPQIDMARASSSRTASGVPSSLETSGSSDSRVSKKMPAAIIAVAKIAIQTARVREPDPRTTGSGAGAAV